MTLPEFLMARIAEDEAAWDEAFANERDAAQTDGGRPFALPPLLMRLPAECVAKRRIIADHCHVALPEHHRVHMSRDRWPDRCGRCWTDAGGFEAHPCPTLRWLALPYAEHPDYDGSWRP